MSSSTLLDRILWTQLARVVHGSPPEWEPGAASARAIRGVLADTSLDPEESAIVERWDGNREASRVLFDRLLQARVNRAVREGLRIEAARLGLAEMPRMPRVLIVREGAPEEERAGTVAPRGRVPHERQDRRREPRSWREARRARRSARARQRGGGR